MTPNISIVIPFHNEEESLRVLIPSLMEIILLLAKSFEVILVDDASTDNSVEIVKMYQERYPIIKLIRLPERGGQSGCYKEAFQQVQGQYIIRMDADLQDDPKDLPKFIEKIDQGSELVMGLRECRKHSRILRLATGIYDLMILALFNSPIHSNSGSYVAFKTDLMKNIPFRKNDHRYLPLIAMRRGAKNITEVFVRHNERKMGKSKYNTSKKLILGIPETFLFLIRYIRGIYDLK
jgi:glycosyltransferase involved in cell wall biosynthesis